jgi:hypothetical protein
MAITRLERPVRRRVTSHRGQPLVVSMMPEGLYVREHGRRTAYLVPWGMAYVYGARLAAERIRAEKSAARKARRAGRKGRL